MLRAALTMFVVATGCANPGGPYSDLAVATFGDPAVDGGSAGTITITTGQCAPPDAGLYSVVFVERRPDGGLPTGTCGQATSSYVNGSSLSAPPYCPRGTGMVTSTSVTADGGARECAVVTHLFGCAVSADTTLDTFIETGTWSADHSTFTGELTLSATTDGKACTDSYTATFTRQ